MYPFGSINYHHIATKMTGIFENVPNNYLLKEETEENSLLLVEK